MVGNDHVSSWGGGQGSSRDHAPGTCAATASPLPRLGDLFCCAGGAARGYQRAGFHVTGFDIAPQPRYIGDAFEQRDILSLTPGELRERFDAIHASPPCQVHSITAKLGKGRGHVDLIPQARALLKASGLPYIIENVPGAPLIDPLILCGTMFGLRVFRHRLFECSFFALTPAHSSHRGTTNSSRTYSTFATGADMICVAGHNFRREDGAAAMGIDWPARREEIAQAIPPAYTEWLGAQLMRQIQPETALDERALMRAAALPGMTSEAGEAA